MGRFKAILSIGLVALALAGQSVLPAAAATPAEQARVIELTNQARAANGLGPVVAQTSLTASAEAYSVYMATANFFSHAGLNGSTMVQRDEAAGYTGWSFAGENIAAGQTTADQVFQAWMNSPGHRANILDARAKEIGIGHAVGPTSTYKNYWTMEVGARFNVNPTPPAPTATPAPIQPTATPRPPAVTSAPIPVGPPAKFRIQIPSVAK